MSALNGFVEIGASLGFFWGGGWWWSVVDLDVEITSRQRSQALHAGKPDPGGAVVEQASLQHMSVGAALGGGGPALTPCPASVWEHAAPARGGSSFGFRWRWGCVCGGVCIVHFFKVFLLPAELAETSVKSTRRSRDGDTWDRVKS